MLSRMFVAAGILLAVSPVAFASTSIGTASASGTVRVDGYAVAGNATLFDGSAVAADQTTATLRLDKGTQIKLAPGSEGTLYRDHMVLASGRGEVSASDTFMLESKGLRITPEGAKAHGMISVMPDNTIEVAALSGELQVSDNNGLVLAHIRAGSAKSFAALSAEGGGSGGGKKKAAGAGWSTSDIIVTGLGTGLLVAGFAYAIANTTGKAGASR